MIHRLEIDENHVVICGDKFLEEFNNALRKEVANNMAHSKRTILT